MKIVEKNEVKDVVEGEVVKEESIDKKVLNCMKNICIYYKKDFRKIEECFSKN